MYSLGALYWTNIFRLFTVYPGKWFQYFHLSLEAATGGVLLKKLFLEISKNSQENTCARVSF